MGFRTSELMVYEIKLEAVSGGSSESCLRFPRICFLNSTFPLPSRPTPSPLNTCIPIAIHSLTGRAETFIPDGGPVMPQQLELFPEIIQESDDIDVLCALLQSSKIGNFQSVLGICSSLSTNAADGAGDRKRPTKSDVQQEAY